MGIRSVLSSNINKSALNTAMNGENSVGKKGPLIVPSVTKISGYTSINWKHCEQYSSNTVPVD